MQVLQKFSNKNLNYKLINKYDYNSIQKIPKIKKIYLNFKTSIVNLKTIAINLVALKLIIPKTKNKIILAKTPNLTLKLKKGMPIGVQIYLFKNKIFLFLNKLIFVLLPFSGNKCIFLKKQKTGKNYFSFSIKNLMLFSKINKFYNIFLNFLPSLNLIIVFKNNIKEEIVFSLKTFIFIYKHKLM